MAEPTWFVFDLGNVVIKIAWERVVGAICARADVERDSLVRLLEEPGGYRDLERGAVSFDEFYWFLVEHGGFRGRQHTLRKIWTDFFDGPIEGMEELLDRVRLRYLVAFLSNSNEVHAEVIPRDFSVLFRKEDRFIFSHELELAKPDQAIYRRMLEILDTAPGEVIYVDDLAENVAAALDLGIIAFQFSGSLDLERTLEEEGLLPPLPRS